MTRLHHRNNGHWSKMNEMELAEKEIERHIDYVDEQGRSVHLPEKTVRALFETRRRSFAHGGGDCHHAYRLGGRRYIGARR